MDEDRVVTITVYKDARVTMDDAHDIKKLTGQMDVSKPHTVLIDLTLVHSIEPEARRVLSTPRNANVYESKAVAIVVKSAISRVIANFFLGSSRPGVPTRLFNSPEDARAFLLTHFTP
jgi:hypothetical protein